VLVFVCHEINGSYLNAAIDKVGGNKV